MIPAALAFKLLGDTPMESLVEKLSGLAGIAPQLLLLGPALFGIAAGLGAMAITGLLALPAIAGLLALSLASAPLIKLAELGVIGDGGGGEDDGDSKIIDKLDELIELVAAGGDVILDGNKVGRNLAIASSRIG